MLVSRLARSTAGLAIVTAAYWLYAFLAVPLLEPQVGRGKQMPVEDATARSPSVDLGLAQLFPEGAWERQTPKVLESDSVTLLLKDYAPLPDGRVEIRPCTLLFHSHGPWDPSQVDRPMPIILQPSGGAILEFDEPLDLARGEVGKLIAGRLDGDIRISRHPRSTDGSDRLEIVTRNIELNLKRIWTPHDVEFQLGRSRGSGRDLNITLASTDADGDASPVTGQMGNIRSIELVHVNRIHLETKGGTLLPSVGESDQTLPREDSSEAAPLEVNCDGPAFFDIEAGRLSLEDNVNVVRVFPSGLADQMTCQLLDILFLDSSPADGATASTPPVQTRLEPARLLASGYPVVLRSQRSDVECRGNQFEYDLKAHRIRMQGEDGVFLRRGDLAVETSQLEYVMTPGKQVGQLWAVGPGRLQGRMQGEPLDASWQEKVLLRPDGEHHLLSLYQDARLVSAGTGSLSADQVHLWFREVPASRAPEQETTVSPDDNANQANSVRVVENRASASGNVKIESPQLAGEADHLEIWFEETATIVQGNSPQQGGTGSVRANQGSDPHSGGAWQNSSSRFKVEGKSIRVKLHRTADATSVRDITINGGVYFSQAQVQQSTTQPLVVMGDQLTVENVDSDATLLTIHGAPARVHARGMTLAGNDILMNRATNRVWINGQGWMTLPEQAAGQMSLFGGQSSGGPVAVHWLGGLDFDGTTIRIRRGVEIRTEVQESTADALDLKLDRHIDMGDTTGSGEVAAREVRLAGNVVMHQNLVRGNRKFAVETLHVQKVTVDLRSGDLNAKGPGWLSSVRRRSAEDGAIPARQVSVANENELTYLHIDFARGIDGNVHHRQLQFFDQVRAVSGPVRHWESKLDGTNADALGPQGVLLSCDAMTVAELNGAEGQPAAMEVEALGNTMVEGQTFTARAHRLGYAAGKDMLVLEGGQRGDAELWYQAAAGKTTSHAAARKIRYWPSTQQADVEKGRYLDLNQLMDSE